MAMVMSGQEDQIWGGGGSSSSSSSSKVIVMNEIQRSVDAAKHLRILLMHHHFSKSSQLLSSAEKLLEDIISSSEKALTILKSCSHSLQAGDASVVDSQNIHSKQVSKKRKTVMKCTKEVRVSLETGFDGTVEDGFNWRKYGQKDIRGANHPRGYYRCTHRQQAGCLATKHVQRSDKDPLVFYVTYRGKHTCHWQPMETPPSPLTVPRNSYNNSSWTPNRDNGQHHHGTCTTTTNADVSLPPFPDDIYLASLSHLLKGNVGEFDSGGCFHLDQTVGYVPNSPAGMSESQADSSPDSDDGTHVSFDFSNFVLL